MTTKLYDQDSHCRTFSAQVLSCTPVQGGQWHIVLDQTAFFPEGGGQPGDQGTLDTVRVLDTRERGDAIVHITDGPLTPGTSVTGELDCALPGCSATPGSMCSPAWPTASTAAPTWASTWGRTR